ncbi:MAG: HAMP domain-containing histidine kinase [Planctomycetales bacterium]|nr:HAMP domain-containing histidine kinase [Planctomycetales bacterium]
MFDVLKTQSLATRILVPLVLSAALAAMVVAWTSWTLGNRWAKNEMRDRYVAIQSAIQSSTFPLTPPVLESLSKLTGTHWITVAASSEIIATTISSEQTFSMPDALTTRSGRPTGEADLVEPITLMVQSKEYYAFAFDRHLVMAGDNQASRVVVLFAKENVDAVARRAALLPLLTGLSTIAVVTTLLFFVVSRMIGRLRRLETQVHRIAAGRFKSELTDDGCDEIGRLADAINTMALQLSELWRRVNEQQSAKLLHQISGGMAHQLRNTLTGAKLAMELHQGKFKDDPPEEVRVALRQLEIAEDYVGRLLAVGSKDSRGDRPQVVAECLEDVRSTHEPIARHLRVVANWTVDPAAASVMIKDGPAFSAAVSNLVLNAMQAGDHVEVTARIDQQNRCVVCVTDNGPGIDDEIADAVFDPFVTSKPEGLGLGLPLVKRAAEDFGGSVSWRRSSNQTTFELVVETIIQ